MHIEQTLPKLTAIAIVLFSLMLSPPTAVALDTTTVVGRKGILGKFTYDNPTHRIPAKCNLDPIRMVGENLFRYASLPQTGMATLEWEEALYLQEAVNYLTGIPKQKIPPLLKHLPPHLANEGFHIYRMKRLQPSAMMVMIANSIFIMLRTNRTEEEPTSAALRKSGGTNGAGIPMQPTHPYYVVVKGYRPVTRVIGRVFRKNERKEWIELLLFDNRSIMVHRQQNLCRKMVPVFDSKGASHNVPDAKPVIEPHVWVNDAYMILPRQVKAHEYLNKIFEYVPYSIKKPEIERMK